MKKNFLLNHKSIHPFVGCDARKSSYVILYQCDVMVKEWVVVGHSTESKSPYDNFGMVVSLSAGAPRKN